MKSKHGLFVGASILAAVSFYLWYRSPKKSLVKHGVESLIGNTPLLEIKSLSRITGCRVLAKAEFLNVAGSTKDRVALAIIEEGEARGDISPHTGCVIFEGTVGSTGISLATIARAKGYHCHIIMPNDVAVEKSRLLETLGATVEKVLPCSIVDPNHFVNLAGKKAHEMNKRAQATGSLARGFFCNQFENMANFKAHLATTGPEIYRQAGGEIDAVVMGAGTGGTICGIAHYLKPKLPGVKMVLADPQGSGLFNKVRYNTMYSSTEAEGSRKRHQIDSIVEGIGLTRLTANFNHGLELIDDAVKVTDQEAVEMSRHLLKQDGIFVGSSSAVNCVAALKTAQQLGPGHTVVTLLCDSGSRHLTKFYNDDFLVAQGLSLSSNGTTKLLLTKIPHFKEIVLMAFECPHCNFRNNEIQSASAIAEKGIKQSCKITNQKDLNRQVVKGEFASVRFEELDFEIPASSQRGVLSTVDGILDRAIEGLQQDQALRKIQHPDLHDQIEGIVSVLKSYYNNESPFTISLDDPTGNSYIENLCAPSADPQMTTRYYERTAEQQEEIGLPVEQPPAPAEEPEDEFDLNQQVHVFPGNCSRCNGPGETKMHLLGTRQP
ncbi:hypothetical protein HDU91_000759 [Kappamyces sp. JEL0680]|nr:hypothetical protein HDU91_000759 [Kappamyces sp. JEL0680]